jgi:probable aminopeptidase NPEPL1
LAARLVDMPPNELTTTMYANLVRQQLQTGFGDHDSSPFLSNVVTIQEIVGQQLEEQGLGGLYSVGQAATCPPRLLMLDYHPAKDTTAANNDKETASTNTTDKLNAKTVALVGKGIVYDTGGLSLKTKTGMPGMKMDMGGSAALLGAFIAAVTMMERARQDAISESSSDTRPALPLDRLVLILCLAENAIGPTAFRNDDIITMYSGKTVEINNTDAEGRLVLGDGVAYATRHVESLDLVLDMATLTGAQLVTTGRTHGAVLANTAALERHAVAAGLASGDVVHPLLYAPELLLREFESKVADLKNSVADRNNGQSSCAGHFIEAHLSPTYRGGYLHVDMAGPVERDGRATAYGVALVLALLNVPGFGGE